MSSSALVHTSGSHQAPLRPPAGVYYEQNKLELAIQTYTRALQLEPNFPEAYNNLVSVRGQGHDHGCLHSSTSGSAQ